MTSTFRTEYKIRKRYTDLLQQGNLTPAEATEFALLRTQVNAIEAPLYASLPVLLAVGVGIDDPPAESVS